MRIYSRCSRHQPKYNFRQINFSIACYSFHHTVVFCCGCLENINYENYLLESCVHWVRDRMAVSALKCAALMCVNSIY